MQKREINFTLVVFKNEAELPPADAKLLQAAVNALKDSYSPYSNFKVAAAILLKNGKVVTGTNQENASFPAGICAEGTALSVASSLYPGVTIRKIAITAKSENKGVNNPIAPCGVCRQRLLEYEMQYATDIEVLMAGEKGEIYSVKSVKELLPLYFSSKDFKKKV